MSHNFDPNQNYYSFTDNNSDPLVFIHGVGLDHRMWEPQISSLNNYSLITYDLLGHGKTPYNQEEITMNDFSKQLDDLINFLKVDKINLIGFSLGALIALDFASKFQNRLKTLTLLGTTYRRTEEQRNLVIDRFEQAKLNKPISKQALKRWFTDKYLEKNPNIYEKISSILEGNNKENFLKVYELFILHKNDENFKNIKVNTLIMTGENDIGSTVEMSKNLSNVIENSQLKVIKNGKHLCSIECADEVNMTIKNFIKDNG